MDNLNAEKIDIHGLQILCEVYVRGSFTTAAAALGLHQSSVSYSIERLRKVFADELFVRLGKTIQPTERCEKLVNDARRILDIFADMARPAHFDPAEARQTFRISCNYYERAVIVPAIFRNITREAPGIKLSLVQAHPQDHQRLIENGCDVMISPLFSDMPGLMTRKLLSEHYVCLLARDDPRVETGLSAADYAAGRHVMVTYDGHWRPFYLDRLEKAGIELDVAIEIPSFGTLGPLLRGSELIATVPAALAPLLEADCATVMAPFDSVFDIHMLWSARHHSSPYHIWLRQQIVRSVGSDIVE